MKLDITIDHSKPVIDGEGAFLTSSKRSVLIITSASDSHAINVAAALRMLGHICEIWRTDYFPTRQKHSFSFDAVSSSLSLSQADAAADVSRKFDSVWVRRPKEEVPDLAEVHVDDHAYVRSAMDRYHKSLRQFLGSSVSPIDAAMWVNNPVHASAAESKLLQLEVARRLGFPIPRTLVTNDGARVRSFIAETGGRAIQKSLVQFVWQEGEHGWRNQTSEVTADDLPSDRTLSFTSEIFQEKIVKTAEVRATFFGRTCFALQMKPGPDGRDHVDWRRYHYPSRADCRQIALPETVHERCLAMLRALGLASGSFDLMIDEKGEFVFAELNQSGQFLWLEAHGLPVLAGATAFLASGDPEFEWVPSADPVSLHDTKNSTSYEELLAEEAIFRRQLGPENARTEPALEGMG